MCCTRREAQRNISEELLQCDLMEAQVVPRKHPLYRLTFFACSTCREAQRNTSEAALQRDLMEARDMARRAEEKAVRAIKGKTAYKEQV